jgi:hypothetical protein
MTRTEPMKVTVEARVQVGTSRPLTFGWEATFSAADSREKISRDITDICRRLHEETQQEAAR